MTELNKRVYGIIGIGSKMSNWNADFSGFPKSLSSGEIFGSDKALKYTMKKKWSEQGEKVIYIKSYTIGDKGNLMPRTLKERYEQVFDTEIKSGESEKILTNLFMATDVKNFGATFAEKGNNISITGAVQISQGMNKYEDSRAQVQQILSPFRDPNAKEKSKSGEEAQNSTLGNKIVSDEAHYFYSFVINPKAYDDYKKLGFTEGYSDEDYEKFKLAATDSATSYATNAKEGANNEFSMFVETKLDTYLPSLANYIKFEKNFEENSKDKIIFTGKSILEKRDDIEKIQIYYDNEKIDLVDFPDNIEIYNIYTREKIEA